LCNPAFHIKKKGRHTCPVGEVNVVWFGVTRMLVHEQGNVVLSSATATRQGKKSKKKKNRTAGNEAGGCPFGWISLARCAFYTPYSHYAEKKKDTQKKKSVEKKKREKKSDGTARTYTRKRSSRELLLRGNRCCCLKENAMRQREEVV
jgi:hypothetical protein